MKKVNAKKKSDDMFIIPIMAIALTIGTILINMIIPFIFNR